MDSVGPITLDLAVLIIPVLSFRRLLLKFLKNLTSKGAVPCMVVSFGRLDSFFYLYILPHTAVSNNFPGSLKECPGVTIDTPEVERFVSPLGRTSLDSRDIFY